MALAYATCSDSFKKTMRHLFSPYLFPGLPQLYYHGSPIGLVIAMIFAIFAIFVVSATLVWEEIVPPASRGVLLGMFVAAWVFGVAISWQTEKRFLADEAKKKEEFQKNDTLYLAQTAYLRREWYEAERILRERLMNWPGDVPAGFLLVSLLRRTDRRAEAENWLKTLEETPGLGSWFLEIYRERELLVEDSS